MTVHLEVPVIRYIGNGITTDYTFEWSCADANENYVKLNTVLLKEGVEYELEDFTTENGGAIVFNEAPAVDDDILIYRQTPITQEVDYVEFEAFPADTHEFQMDKDTRILQEMILGGLGVGGAVDLGAIQWPTYVEVTNTSGTNANINPWTIDGLLAGVSMGEVIQFGDTAPIDGNPTLKPNGYIWWQLGPLPDVGGDVTIKLKTAPLTIASSIASPTAAYARFRYMAQTGEVEFGYDPQQPLVAPEWTDATAIGPSPIALNQYWVKMAAVSGTAEGSAVDVWLDAYAVSGNPDPYYEWYVLDPGTTQDFVGWFSVAPDDGAGSPDTQYEITVQVNLSAVQT